MLQLILIFEHVSRGTVIRPRRTRLSLLTRTTDDQIYRTVKYLHDSNGVAHAQRPRGLENDKWEEINRA